MVPVADNPPGAWAGLGIVFVFGPTPEEAILERFARAGKKDSSKPSAVSSHRATTPLPLNRELEHSFIVIPVDFVGARPRLAQG